MLLALHDALFYTVATLEETVVSYLNLRKEIAEEFPNIFNRPKPKHHYMFHLPEYVVEDQMLPGGFPTERRHK